MSRNPTQDRCRSRGLELDSVPSCSLNADEDGMWDGQSIQQTLSRWATRSKGMRLSTVEPKTITGEGRRLDPIEPASLDPDDGSDAEDVERRLPQHHAVPTTEREEKVQPSVCSRSCSRFRFWAGLCFALVAAGSAVATLPWAFSTRERESTTGPLPAFTAAASTDPSSGRVSTGRVQRRFRCRFRV